MDLDTILGIEKHLRNDDRCLTPTITGLCTPVRDQTQHHADGGQYGKDGSNDDGSTAVREKGSKHVLHCSGGGAQPVSQKECGFPEKDRRPVTLDTRVCTSE